MKTRNITIILIILLSATCRNREVKTSSAEAIHVRVTGVTATAISIPVHTSGTLVSSEELKLSFKTGGIVAMIYVKESFLLH
jgi:multidrug efflux pump subunit AcrA (membrane-fusion protein)